MSDGTHFCCVMDKEKPCGMEPVINRGDFVFVKREAPQVNSESFPVKGRIYLLRIKNDLIFRYLSPYDRPDGSRALMITAEDRSQGLKCSVSHPRLSMGRRRWPKPRKRLSAT